MKRTIVAGVMCAVALNLVAGCGPARPPELDKLAVDQAADLFNG